MKFKKTLCITFAICQIFAVCGCQKKVENTDGDVSLKWFFPGDVQEDQDKVWNAFNEKVKEKINAEVDIHMLDRGSYDSKMSMILASGEVFDMCFTSNWTNNFVTNVAKGAYMPIDEYLDKSKFDYMPDYVWNCTMYNGKTYGVPSYQMMFTQSAFVTPVSLYKKYPVLPEKINDIKEVEPYLEAIKENEPQLYPIQFNAYIGDYEAISSSGMCIKRDGSDFNVVPEVMTDSYKQMLIKNRDWFEKGYFRPDILTNTDDRNDKMNLKYGLMNSSYKPGAEAELKSIYGTDMMTVPVGEPYVTASAGIGAITSLSTTSKNPQKSVDFLVLLGNDKELYNMFIYGNEGEHYIKIDDETIEKVENTKYSMTSQWMFGNQFNAYYQPEQEKGSWELTDKMNRESAVSPISGFTLDIDSIKNEIANCSAVTTEYQYIKYGTQDWEKPYAEMIEKLNNAGLEKIRAEVQRQLDEWLSKK